MRRRKFTPPDDYGMPEDEGDGVVFEDAAEGPYHDEPTLGPDERDRDLIDGSWEKRYYQGRLRQRDWNSIGAGIALLILVGMILPMLLVFFR